MKPDEMLSADLLWQPDGHVTDEVLTLVADGQEALLPAPALGHVDRCEACGARLGRAALLSVSVQGWLEAMPVSVQPQSVRWPLPVGALLMALVVALAGALPVLLIGARDLWVLSRLAPQLLRSLVVLLRSGSLWMQTLGLGLSLGTALVLVTAGLSIARMMTPRLSSQGGV